MPYKKSLYTLLLINKVKDDFLLVRGLLANIGDFFKLDWVDSYTYGIEAVMSNSHDIYLIDDKISDNNGLDLLKEIRSYGIDKPVVLLTENINTELDIQSLKAGASDFLVKSSLSSRGLEHSLRHCIQRYEYSKMFQESQRLLRSFFTTNLAPTFIMDAACILKEMNPAFLTKFGNIKPGTSIASIFADQKEFELQKKSLHLGSPAQNCSTYLLDSEHNKMEVSINLFRYLTEEDNQVYYFGVINDLT